MTTAGRNQSAKNGTNIMRNPKRQLREPTMESQTHTLANLFAQLGLPGDQAAIEAFIEQHAPLPNDLRLADAPFWTPSQAAFLKADISEDSDWSAVVDGLDVLLRRKA